MKRDQRLHGASVALLVLFLACEVGPEIEPGDSEAPLAPSAEVTRTLWLADEGFESTPLGQEPYPFIAETWCANSFIGASEDAAHSGTRSFKYRHDCAPGTPATITTFSFSLCTRWPTGAHVVFHRRHDVPGISLFSVHSGHSGEPPTSLFFTGDGGIHLNDGVGSTLVGLHTLGEWTKIDTAWDFQDGRVDLAIDDAFVGTFVTRVTQAFWLAFGSWEPGTTFYDDDVTVSVDVVGERTGCTGLEPLPWPWPPPEGQLGG